MAGLTDQPFRNLCREFGAGMATSEMTTADTAQWQSRKSRHRLVLNNENGLKVVQIAGNDPAQIALAAQAIEALGADIIDLNMGCPAKKVCKKLAGSALLQDETLVAEILQAAVSAVSIPVTLKIRTGWNIDNRNGPKIAAIAEDSGIAALAVHGRTRSCMFKGNAEYDTIAEIKQRVKIPVFANGDIKTPQQAAEVLEKTGADGVMIGRAALGQPWLFTAINAWLDKKVLLKPPSIIEQRDIILSHLNGLHELYGSTTGVRVARKHLTWYCQYLEGAEEFRNSFVRINSVEEQLQTTIDFFNRYQLVAADADLASLRHREMKSGETSSWYQARNQSAEGQPKKQPRKRLQ
jgi:tRNA-dihydrouridine synthase B